MEEAFKAFLLMKNISETEYNASSVGDKIKLIEVFEKRNSATVYDNSFKLFHSSWLASKGLTGRDDQYLLYGTLAAGLGTFTRQSYKHYLLRAYIKETDPIEKDIIGGRFPFSNAELRGAQQYLNRYQHTPRIWLVVYPLIFVSYEFHKRVNFGSGVAPNNCNVSRWSG